MLRQRAIAHVCPSAALLISSRFFNESLCWRVGSSVDRRQLDFCQHVAMIRRSECVAVREATGLIKRQTT